MEFLDGCRWMGSLIFWNSFNSFKFAYATFVVPRDLIVSISGTFKRIGAILKEIEAWMCFGWARTSESSFWSSGTYVPDFSSYPVRG